MICSFDPHNHNFEPLHNHNFGPPPAPQLLCPQPPIEIPVVEMPAGHPHRNLSAVQIM